MKIIKNKALVDWLSSTYSLEAACLLLHFQLYGYVNVCVIFFNFIHVFMNLAMCDFVCYIFWFPLLFDYTDDYIALNCSCV